MDVEDGTKQPLSSDAVVAASDPRAPGEVARRGDYRWMGWLIVVAPLAALAVVGTLAFLSAITDVLRTLLLAEFLALALEPGVNWLARHGWRRGLATGALMAGIGIVAIGVIWMILPTLISELAALVANLPETFADFGRRLGLDVSVDAIEQVLASEREALASLAADLAGNVLNLTGAFLSLIGTISVVGLLSFYLATEAPKVRRTVCALLPRKQQVEVLRLWEIAIDKIGGYLYSRALMGLISGTASYITLRILAVPFAAPLSIFIGFVSQFVPVVGTYLAYALPVIVALSSKGGTTAVILVGFAVVYQQIENLFISPKISAKTMELHPAVAFVAAMIGGAVGGLAAAFLALPVAAIFQAFMSTFLKRYEVVDSQMTVDQPAPREGRREDGEKVPLLKRFSMAIKKSDPD